VTLVPQTLNADGQSAAGRTLRRRVLILVPGALSEQMAGPVIRAWSIARALAAQFDVTAAVHDPPATHLDGVRLVSFERRVLRRELVEHDVLISACVPPYLLSAKGIRPTIIVSDQYDPADLEASSLPKSLVTGRQVRSQIAVKDLQLRHADVVLYANERQRDRIQRRLRELGRSQQPDLIELPFGLGDPPPPARNQLLRERFPQIDAGDAVVLWWGVVWRWLDADTAVRAFALLSETRPDIKLVFAPARTPRDATPATAAQNSTEEVRDTARQLGVLDRTVLFWDDWVPFAQRHELLAEADIGLTLHGVTDEAHFSARVRYLDYLWAELPCVLAEGDLTGARFAQAGFSKLVPPGDPTTLAAAIVALVDDRDGLARARQAGARLSREYRWDKLVAPLASAVAQRPQPLRRKLNPQLALGVGRYYLRRTGDAAIYAMTRSREAAAR
jgi:glycosyltransferase involved in cell wall biosynthesis